jgi:hypothetical protein
VYFQRFWKRGSVTCPFRESFATKVFVEQVLMSVEQNLNTELIALSDNFSELFNVRVIILSFFRFDTLPSDMKSDVVKTPMLEVVQINVCERVIRVEGFSVRVKWESFVNCVDAVEDYRSVVLINKERTLGINTK